jgi:hypothetical protein
MAELRDLVDNLSVRREVSVELYTRSAVRSGFVTCPAGSRLSDVLNDAFAGKDETKKAFLGFVPADGPADAVQSEGRLREYIRKSAIDLVAVANGNQARGMGSTAGGRVRLNREKAPAPISLELGSYTLIGNLYRVPGQTVEAVLNNDDQFLPLTDVTMVRENLVYGTRPFVAVNKREIISCREEN